MSAGGANACEGSQLADFLRSSELIDWHHPAILDRAERLAAGCDSVAAVTTACFTWVRDGIAHSGDHRLDPVTCRASDVLAHGTGFCFAKSHLLAALLRARGIRIDARGNTATIDAQFTPPAERLAYRLRLPGEIDLPGRFAEPVSVVVAALLAHRRREELLQHLPDAPPAMIGITSQRPNDPVSDAADDPRREIPLQGPAAPVRLLRLTAFSSDPAGGNPAGVWIGEELPAPEEMQRIAAAVGYSETAFLAPAQGLERTVRYFSPEAEVPFCGHATIAAGVALGAAEGDGLYGLDTAVGPVPVAVTSRQGLREAALTSVPPAWEPAGEGLLARALALLDWSAADLDPAIPPARAFAGAWHLVLAAASAGRLARLTYDFEGLKALMQREDLTTLQLVWRESETVFHSRNPFPVGGVVEDPATGSAAAALGGYLREARLLPCPATLLIRQGDAIGRPSRLTVEIPAAGGIVVRGTAVPLDPPAPDAPSPPPMRG